MATRPADNPGQSPSEMPPLPGDPGEPDAPGELPMPGPDTDVPEEAPVELPGGA